MNSGQLKTGHTQGNAILIPQARAADTTFRILVVGPEDVIPSIAKEMKEFIYHKHKITKLKIHHASNVNEQIAHKLAIHGLHAVVLCIDSSQSLTRSNTLETLKHLHFELISSSLFILNIIQPRGQIFPTVADAIDKLSIIYNIDVINIQANDINSVRFGVCRVSTAALRLAKFIYGYEPPTFKNIDYNQLDNSIFGNKVK